MSIHTCAAADLDLSIFTNLAEQLSLDGARAADIIWDEQGQKWMDRGNDVWCSQNMPDGQWSVRHRYGFDARGLIRWITFTSSIEALAFYNAYLVCRASADYTCPPAEFIYPGLTEMADA